MPLNGDLPGIIRVGQGAAISLDVACEDNSFVIVCVSVSCGGRAGLFPGQLQPASCGFCACQETREERIGWMRRSLGLGREAVFAAFPEVIGFADDPPRA